MKHALHLAFFVAMLATVSENIRAAVADWQLISVGGRDYLSLGNVASFYRLHAEQSAVDNHWTLGDSRTRLETCNNPREIYVNGVKQWLAYPLLIQNGETLISRLDLAKTVEPCLRPTMIGNLTPFRTVVLDAGHGGQDGGSHNGAGQEKDYTLDVVKDLQKSLEAKGLKVVLTRGDDTYQPLEMRADFANHASNAVFVSVHFNSSADASAKGFEVFAMTPCGAASTSDLTPTPDQFKQMPA